MTAAPRATPVPSASRSISSNEYWVKAGSLLHTDTRGNDLKDPEDVRFYLISGLSHGVGDITDREYASSSRTPSARIPSIVRSWSRSTNG